MLSKAKIKLINSLNHAKYRTQHGLFVVEGTINVLDFLQSGMEPESVYATGKWIREHQDGTGGVKCTETDEKELKKISFLKTPPEVVFVVRIPEWEDFDLKNLTGLMLMLDGIQDPGNMGTIIRTADWFGIETIVCSPASANPFNPKVVQASMGSLSRVKVYTADLAEMLKNRPDYLNTFGAVLNGEPLDEIAKPQTAIIIIGNEARGISKELLPIIDFKITIPGYSGSKTSSAESLNASIATAIICYEFRK